ncbi:hypothetical protein DN595_17245 [Enterobacter cloacae]|uniref:Uncharacterized protein n=1 Tax=Enterobacter cloacae TaxID=550 RepID=A0AB37VJ80_ENTCL|nr:hypothetical protein DN595_17245 [Enterobacter cloacae]
MMSLWDALRMNMMISYQELVRTFLSYLSSEKIARKCAPLATCFSNCYCGGIKTVSPPSGKNRSCKHVYWYCAGHRQSGVH